MKYYISVILVLLLVSCGSHDKNHDLTYFGGKIINPKSNVVLFLKDDVVLDTIALDEHNRFMTSFDDFEEGLYTFRHGAEFQYIYLKPKDSVLVRLNTWDFDESLVYSGVGGARNDYLISLFLQNEKEEKAFYKNFGLDEKAFQAKFDELIQQRLTTYEAYVENDDSVTEGFEKLAKTAIYYPLYRLKEMYPYYNKNVNKNKNLTQVSDAFYAYRDEIDFNAGELLAYYPYQNYLTSYLYHVSDEKSEHMGTSDQYTVHLLNTVLEVIDHEGIKNTMLKKFVVSDFLKSGSTCTMDEKTLEVFIENCTNEAYITEVKNLVHDSKAVCNKEPLDNFEVVSYTKEKSVIQDHIRDQNAVLYFWSTAYHSSDYILHNISYLEKKFPDIAFIGINLEMGINRVKSYEDMDNEPNLKKLDIDRQFKLTPESSAHNFLTSNYPRVILVDNSGVVQNGFTYLEVKRLIPDLKKLEKL